MNATILLVTSKPFETNLSSGYIIVAIISLFILDTFYTCLLNPKNSK
jgi:hypothetical protein